jgi:hypothetical protein
MLNHSKNNYRALAERQDTRIGWSGKLTPLHSLAYTGAVANLASAAINAVARRFCVSVVVPSCILCRFSSLRRS